MKVGEAWIGPDGTRYIVIDPVDVGGRTRWFVDAGMVDEYDHVSHSGFGAGTTESPRWHVGPEGPEDLHMEPLCTTCEGDDRIVFALVQIA